MRIVVVNVNPDARTRTGTRALVRSFARLVPTADVVERHFLRLSARASVGVGLVVIGPQGVPFDAYPAAAREHLFSLLRAIAASAATVDEMGAFAPDGHVVFGVCGGHQALALAFGGTVAPVHGGVASGSYDGHRKETGERQVIATEVADPFAELLPGSFVVSHVEGVATLPPDFVLVGRGDPCVVQLMRHRSRAVWGAQFHPERGADGDRVLARLFALARRNSHT